MNSIRNIQKLNERELEAAVPSSGSWHTDYRDTAYIYIGGLGHELSEGDVITIFSQYGDPVWIKLARDKETGKSRGFAWLKYEDQRSCDLAVDNLSGASVLGRLLAVDHTRYKKRDDEVEADGYVGQGDVGPRGTHESAGESGSESESVKEAARPLIREEVELEQLRQDYDDDDPMKAYMLQSKEEEIARALAARSIGAGAPARDGGGGLRAEGTSGGGAEITSGGGAEITSGGGKILIVLTAGTGDESARRTSHRMATIGRETPDDTVKTTGSGDTGPTRGTSGDIEMGAIDRQGAKVQNTRE